MARPGNPALLRRINRTLVLDALADGATTSRAELAGRLGLAKPTVGAIVGDLVAEGLVRELGPGSPTARGGRRPALLALAPDAVAHAGIHFGVSTTRVAVADATGAVRATLTAPSPRRAPRRSVALARRLVGEAFRVAQLPADRLRAVGLAVPGPVDTDRGVCTVAPNLGWRDVPIEAMVSRALGVPAVARNIAHAGCLAEHAAGAARGTEHVVWLYVGTGVGAGAMDHGRLVAGHRGLGGEIGHCPLVPDGPVCGCGRTGCLETRASGRALAAAAGTADAEEAFARAAAGDPRATAAVTELAGWLARGVATLIDLSAPELVVVGGGLAGAGEALLGPLRDALAGRALRDVAVVGSLLGDDAEVTGAVLLARQHGRAELTGGAGTGPGESTTAG